jgi:hypothetical protein
MVPLNVRATTVAPPSPAVPVSDPLRVIGDVSATDPSG